MKLAATCTLLALLSAAAHATSTPEIRAEMTARSLATAAELLTRDSGNTPQAAEWPLSLTARPPGATWWRGPYIKQLTKDPWGNEYRLLSCASPGAHCRVYSIGKDAVDNHGEGDDVTSWAGYELATYAPDALRNRIIALVVVIAIAIGIGFAVLRSIRRRTPRAVLPNKSLERTRAG